MCKTSKTIDALIALGKTGVTAEQAHKGLSSSFKRLNELMLNCKGIYCLPKDEVKRMKK